MTNYSAKKENALAAGYSREGLLCGGIQDLELPSLEICAFTSLHAFHLRMKTILCHRPYGSLTLIYLLAFRARPHAVMIDEGGKFHLVTWTLHAQRQQGSRCQLLGTTLEGEYCLYGLLPRAFG